PASDDADLRAQRLREILAERAAHSQWNLPVPDRGGRAGRTCDAHREQVRDPRSARQTDVCSAQSRAEDVAGRHARRPIRSGVPRMSAAEERSLRRRVLVVDDDPEIVTFLATLLELEGIDSTVATSAAAALEKLEHAVPNLVLLDIAMPDRDGLDLCRALTKDPRPRDVPVFVVAAQMLELEEYVELREPILGQAFLISFSPPQPLQGSVGVTHPGAKMRPADILAPMFESGHDAATRVAADDDVAHFQDIEPKLD